MFTKIARSIISDRACRWGCWTSESVIDTLVTEHGLLDEDARQIVAAFKQSIDGMGFLGTCSDVRR